MKISSVMTLLKTSLPKDTFKVAVYGNLDYSQCFLVCLVIGLQPHWHSNVICVETSALS